MAHKPNPKLTNLASIGFVKVLLKLLPSDCRLSLLRVRSVELRAPYRLEQLRAFNGALSSFAFSNQIDNLVDDLEQRTTMCLNWFLTKVIDDQPYHTAEERIGRGLRFAGPSEVGFVVAISEEPTSLVPVLSSKSLLIDFKFASVSVPSTVWRSLS